MLNIIPPRVDVKSELLKISKSIGQRGTDEFDRWLWYGRNTYFVSRTITTISGATRLLCSPSNQRVGLWFFGTGSASTFVNTINSSSQNDSIGISNNFNPQIMHVSTHGALVMAAWYGFNTGGGSFPCLVYELFLKRGPGSGVR